jgi:hypothetical protein
MYMKKFISFMLCLLPFVGAVVAQEKASISGRVTNGQGDPLVGATVMVESTSLYALTDGDGHFKLDGAVGDVLKVSYIGFLTQRVTAISNVVDVVLVEEMQTLEGVVVTALGIKRDRKALGYAMQEVK